MPGNTVKINNFDGLEFYVGDSKMDGLMEYLHKHGSKSERFSTMLESVILCQQCGRLLRSIGGESNEENIGFNEHFFCEKCKCNIDVSVKYGITGGDQPVHST